MNKLIYDLSSADYHTHGGSFSSSQLKDILDDPEFFYRKYITKEIEKESIPAFDIGTYFHTAILEPEKLDSECCVYDGKRIGKAWDEFKEKNKSKAIITANEHATAMTLVNAVKSSTIAMGRIGRGRPEVSAFLDVLVTGSDVFTSDSKWVLGKYGWDKAKEKPKKAVELKLKVRADLLGHEKFILDLKSTSGNAKSEFLMKKKISDYNYDLSAALYLDIFTIASGELYDQFIWTFASKDFGNSKSYVASQTNIQVGRAKWKKAVLNLADCIKNDWKFEDSLGVLEPQHYELEILKHTEELL